MFTTMIGMTHFFIVATGMNAVMISKINDCLTILHLRWVRKGPSFFFGNFSMELIKMDNKTFPMIYYSTV